MHSCHDKSNMKHISGSTGILIFQQLLRQAQVSPSFKLGTICRPWFWRADLLLLVCNNVAGSSAAISHGLNLLLLALVSSSNFAWVSFLDQFSF